MQDYTPEQIAVLNAEREKDRFDIELAEDFRENVVAITSSETILSREELSAALDSDALYGLNESGVLECGEISEDDILKVARLMIWVSLHGREGLVP